MLRVLMQMNLVHIVDPDESYFQRFGVEKNVWLDADMLRLNYAHYAPYRDPFIVAFKERTWLYVWFLKAAVRRGILIPRAHILYMALKREYQDGIVLMPSNGKTLLLALKEGYLRQTFYAASVEEDELQKLQAEYGIERTIRLDQAAYNKLLEKAVARYPLSALFQWMRSSIDFKAMLWQGVDKAAYPAAALLCVFMAIDYGASQFLTQKYDRLSKQYLALKHENDPVRRQVNQREAVNEKFSAFTKTELDQEDPMKLYDLLIPMAAAFHGEFEDIVIENGRVVFVLVAQTEASELIAMLSQTKRFSDIRVTREQDLHHKGYKRISISAVTTVRAARQ